MRRDSSEKVTLKNIRGIVVYTACTYCKEDGRVPGGKYKHEGEIVNCPYCDGIGAQESLISWNQFLNLLAKEVVEKVTIKP